MRARGRWIGFGMLWTLPLPWLLVALPSPAFSQARQLLFEERFEPRLGFEPVGSGRTHAASTLSSSRRPLIPAPQDPHLSLVSGAGPDGSTALQVLYVPNAKGSERVAINLPLQGSVSQARLAFDVRFELGFDFAEGGKLLGLAPRRPVTGGDPRRPDGWSARLAFQPRGRVATYLYDQPVSRRRFGVGKKSREQVFWPGTWHHISLDLQLNDPGQANGTATIHVDGALVVKSNGLELRGSGADRVLIERLLFHTFHGGSHEGYTPRDAAGQPTIVRALFDNIQVTSDQPLEP